MRLLTADLAGIVAIAIVAAVARDTQIDTGIRIGAAAAAGRVVDAAHVLTLGATGAEIGFTTAEAVANRTAPADRVAAAVDQAAMLVVLAAARAIGAVTNPVGGRQAAGPLVGGATELFAIAGAKAAGVVAAFGVGRTGPSGVTAIGSALLCARRRWGQADALSALGSLLAGAANRSWGGGWTASGVRIVFQRCGSHQRGATQPEESLQNRPAAGTRSQRSR